ncbi:MAG: hypothetical protein EOO20_01990 [Chryseobacterium sp.]|nr:MAG: hypothetical protein EOO20_01990 [Chryseobacterium sp.]
MKKKITSDQAADLLLRDEALRRELRDTRILQRISNHIIEEENVESFYDLLLEAAMELMYADFASIQIFKADQNALYLLAHRNFHPSSSKQWEYVKAGQTTSCGQTGK